LPGGDFVQSYRLYFLDAQGRHIKAFQQFEAEDDESAMAAAERFRGEGPMELWCSARRVEKWPALLNPASKPTE